MDYNLQVRLSEAVNFWNHFLAHFDSGDLTSIYNPEYLQKVATAGGSVLASRVDRLEPLIKPYYQILCFLPYLGLDSVATLWDLLKDEDKLLNFVSSLQKNYQPEGVRKLAQLLLVVLQTEYDSFYKKFWQDNLAGYKDRQLLVVEEMARVYPTALKYFLRINPEIRLGQVEIFLVEALGGKGKGLGTAGCAIGLPAGRRDVLEKLLTGLHELAHAFTDPLFNKLGLGLTGRPTEDNKNHMAREMAVTYLLEVFLKNSGAKLTRKMTGEQMHLIPYKIKMAIEGQSSSGNLEFHGIKTAALGPTKSFMLMGKKLKWCPDIFVIEKKDAFFTVYSPLVNRLYSLDAKYLSKIGSRILSVEEQKLFAGAQLLVPGDKSLAPVSAKSLSGDNIRIHLTSDCNLRCAYCYLSAGEKKQKTSPAAIKRAIDRCLNPEAEKVTVEFHGGGEPTLELATIRSVVEYVRGKFKKSVFKIQTNGLFSGEALDYLINNDFRISFSIDGPPPLQKLQRPTLENNPAAIETIEKNIRSAIKAGLRVMSIAIVTRATAPYLKEIFWYLYHLGIRRMMFNPLSQLGRARKAASPQTSAPDLRVFVRDFLSLSEIAEWLDTIIISDFLPKYIGHHQTLDVACNACSPGPNLTEDGHLVACTRAFSLAAPEKNPFVYGRYDENLGDFVIDEKRVADLQTRTMDRMKKPDGSPGACRSCLLKWDCSGDCLSELYQAGGDYYKTVAARCQDKLLYARNYLRYLAQREFIKIRPYLELEKGQMFFRGYFNHLRLRPVSGPGIFQNHPLVRISLKNDSLKDIYKLIISFQKRIPQKPVLFLLSVEADNVQDRMGAVLESFIKALRDSRILFKIVKPLAALLNQEFIQNYHLPRSCYDCLALFTVNDGRVVFCNGTAGREVAGYLDRDRIYEEFSGVNPDCANLQMQS